MNTFIHVDNIDYDQCNAKEYVRGCSDTGMSARGVHLTTPPSRLSFHYSKTEFYFSAVKY